MHSQQLSFDARQLGWRMMRGVNDPPGRVHSDIHRSRNPHALCCIFYDVYSIFSNVQRARKIYLQTVILVPYRVAKHLIFTDKQHGLPAPWTEIESELAAEAPPVLDLSPEQSICLRCHAMMWNVRSNATHYHPPLPTTARHCPTTAHQLSTTVHRCRPDTCFFCFHCTKTEPPTWRLRLSAWPQLGRINSDKDCTASHRC